MLTFYKKKRFDFRHLILIVNACVMVGCCVYLYQYYKESRQTSQKVEYVKELIEEVEDEEEVVTVVAKPKVDEKTGELIMLSKFKKALKKYPDLVGWITIDDLLDYPVMQTGMDDPLYYLYRNVDGEFSKPGTPYMDARCDISKPSSNFIIYGHNMKNLSMFGWLGHYYSKEFWEEHKEIQFDTLYFTGTYEIFAAFYSEYYGDDPQYEDTFKYYEFIDAKNKKDFNQYVKNIKELALYDTEVDVNYGDQLLTLSTCNHWGGRDDGRFVVMARLKRSDANADNGAKMNLEDDELHKVVPTEEPTEEASEDPDESDDPKNKNSKKPKDSKEPKESKDAKKTDDASKTKKVDNTKKPKDDSKTKEPKEDKTKEPVVPQPPTEKSTKEPTKEPTKEATKEPTKEPTKEATPEPTKKPTPEPTKEPTIEPTPEPTDEPTPEPTKEVTEEPDQSTGEGNSGD